MGVRKYGFDEVRNQIRNGGIPDEDMIMYLSYIGDKMTTHARTITRGHATGGFDDQTNNLRSSIGFRILKDGNPVKDGGFKTEGDGKDGNGGEGKTAAQNALNNFTDDPRISTDGWTLIVVAGMNYAKHVEDKGYNVLFLTNIELEREIEKLKKKLGL